MVEPLSHRGLTAAGLPDPVVQHHPELGVQTRERVEIIVQTGRDPFVGIFTVPGVQQLSESVPAMSSVLIVLIAAGALIVDVIRDIRDIRDILYVLKSPSMLSISV